MWVVIGMQGKVTPPEAGLCSLGLTGLPRQQQGGHYTGVTPGSHQRHLGGRTTGFSLTRPSEGRASSLALLPGVGGGVGGPRGHSRAPATPPFSFMDLPALLPCPYLQASVWGCPAWVWGGGDGTHRNPG